MILAPKGQSRIPLFAECISPDAFGDGSLDFVRGLGCVWGNRETTLGDYFTVEEGGEGIEIFGDVSNVRHIGSRMTRGRIRIHGRAGHHLGSQMSGGEIEVEGDASDWCGAEMRGGTIRIGGSAGNFLGGAYRGSDAGMNRGTIVVAGNAGHECGLRMKRGLIVVRGGLGDFAGLHMKGGTIVCLGTLGRRTGAFMERGTILCFSRPSLMDTFRPNSTDNPTWLRFFFNQHRDIIPIGTRQMEGLYERYSGDITELGKGEILVWVG